MYRHLLSLRKTDPVLRNRSRQHLSAGSVGTDLLWVKTETEAGERVLLWNVGTAELKLDTLPLPFELPGDVMFHSEASENWHQEVTELHPGHALIVGTTP